MSTADDQAALAMQSLLHGGALQDRPYPTSGKLIRVRPIKTANAPAPPPLTPEALEKIEQEATEWREGMRQRIKEIEKP